MKKKKDELEKERRSADRAQYELYSKVEELQGLMVVVSVVLGLAVAVVLGQLVWDCFDKQMCEGYWFDGEGNLTEDFNPTCGILRLGVSLGVGILGLVGVPALIYYGLEELGFRELRVARCALGEVIW